MSTAQSSGLQNLIRRCKLQSVDEVLEADGLTEGVMFVKACRVVSPLRRDFGLSSDCRKADSVEQWN